MRILSAILVAATVWLVGTNAAQADCDSLPKPVRAWIKLHPGWHVVRAADLPDVEQSGWKQTSRNSRGACPGLASAALSGSKAKFHIALLLRKGSGSDDELQMVMFRPGSSKAEILEKDASLSYLYRTKPGSYWNWEARKNIRIYHDAVVQVVAYGPTHLHFLEHGRHKRVLMFD